MKKLKEHLSLISALVSIISAIVTFVSSYIPSKELRDFKFWFVILFSSSIILIINIILSLLLKDREEKIQALFTLSNEKRIHTLNFILFLESLSKSYPKKYGVKNKPYIGNSSYCFHVHNNDVDEDGMADVEYNHAFELGNHKKIFHTLVLYAAGELVTKEVTYKYNNRTMKANLNNPPSIVKNKQNTRIVCCELGLDNNKENISKNMFVILYWLKKFYKNNINIKCTDLKFHYYTKKCHSMLDDEVFIIIPKNYGSRILGEANITLRFDNIDNSINAVSLDVLQLNKGSKGTDRIGVFDYDGKEYHYNVEHLDLNSIYFVVIKRKI